MAPKLKKQVDPRRPALVALGGRIKLWRKEGQLTQVELAEKLGLSVPYVSLIERGQRNPPFTLVTAIARALGISPALLVE